MVMEDANRNAKGILFAVIFAKNHVQGIVLHAVKYAKLNVLIVSALKFVEKFVIFALNHVKLVACILSAQINVRNLAITNLATCPVPKCFLATTPALACVD